MMESLTYDIYDEALKLITEVSKAGHTRILLRDRGRFPSAKPVSLALSVLLVSGKRLTEFVIMVP